MRLYQLEIELDEVVFVELCHLFHRCHFFQLLLHLVIIRANFTILYHLKPQVVEVYSSGNFLLVEVISAKLDGNGTITTAVDINILKSHNRRSRRSTRFDFELASFKPESIHHKVQHLLIVLQKYFKQTEN